MPVCVLDSQSLLGDELCYQLGGDAIPVLRQDLDLLNDQQVFRRILRLQPTAVINAAAYDDVPSAETDREQCFAMNAVAVKRIAEACEILRCPLVHLSTNHVFGADTLRRKPYRETEPTQPVSVFGHSKRAGEVYAAGCHRHFIVRTSDLYSRFSADTADKNVVEAFLRHGLTNSRPQTVSNQYCTPSYAPHIASAILYLLRSTEAYGIYHLGNSGVTTWFEFAEEVFRQALFDRSIHPVTPGPCGREGVSPGFSVLDMTKYRSVSSRDLPSWQSALAEYFASRDDAIGVTDTGSGPAGVVPCNCDELQGHS
jgi:dTDP-4-dehydrorhamnose reductase